MRVKETGFDFNRDGLERSDLDADPFRQFEAWYGQAVEDGVPVPNAMSLATVSARGEPTLRTVLLKLYDERGFVFFTNYASLKARQIGENSNVALLFAWAQSARQVSVRGRAAKISGAESLRYFLARPRGSQLGAWASRQSAEVGSRALLERSFRQVAERFANREIPLPDFWGGFRVEPHGFEFWQGRRDRLHDRFLYSPVAGGWDIRRLNP